MEIEPWIAKEYENVDELTWKITLNDGVVFSNGRACDGQAVKESLESLVENHERAAGEVLEGQEDCLKVLLYNTSMEHRLPRAIADKTYDLEGLEHDELVNFIHREDHKRKVYRDAVSNHLWGGKESYDICLDSDVLSREKCAEVLIEAASDCKLDLEECAQIIKNSFDWTR